MKPREKAGADISDSSLEGLDDGSAASAALDKFRASLTGFIFTAPSSAPTRTSASLGLRRSPQKSPYLLIKPEAEDSATAATSPVSPSPVKRPAESASPRTPRKKPNRGYAPPEVYADLDPLADYLREDLDVIFCGINPGCTSAKTGHHFANPTNHFWRCLHRSNFTDRLLAPSEDVTLPERYGIGITNLVDRPSAEAGELSRAEMTESVPALLDKILRFRPRVVCVVGKAIWVEIEKVILKPPLDGTILLEEEEGDASGSTAESSRSARKAKSKKKSTFGLQRIRIAHQTDPAASGCRETLLFVVPSTSGKVVSHQLADKVKLFQELHDLVEQLKRPAPDPLPSSSSTPTESRHWA